MESRLQLTAHAAVAVILLALCAGTHAGGLSGALSGAAGALGDAADQDLQQQQALERMRVQHELEMESMRRQMQLQRPQPRPARPPDLATWLKTQPPSVQALHGSSRPQDMSLLMDLYRRDIGQQ